jgi:hypothetical protein
MLPNADRAIVLPAKLTGYLLSETHPRGGTKARLLRALGFDESNLAFLDAGLRSIARAGVLVKTERSPYGQKYVVDGDLPTPRRGTIRMRTVWIIATGEDAPRLVSAYPR